MLWLPLYMVFYIRLYRGALVNALVSSFLWMALLYLTPSLPHRSCHSCHGQSATQDSLEKLIFHLFSWFGNTQEARGLFGLSLWPSAEDCGRDGRAQMTSGLLNCSGGGCCDFYQCRLSCSSSAKRARMQKVNSGTSPAKKQDHFLSSFCWRPSFLDVWLIPLWCPLACWVILGAWYCPGVQRGGGDVAGMAECPLSSSPQKTGTLQWRGFSRTSHSMEFYVLHLFLDKRQRNCTHFLKLQV